MINLVYKCKQRDCGFETVSKKELADHKIAHSNSVGDLIQKDLLLDTDY